MATARRMGTTTPLAAFRPIGARVAVALLTVAICASRAAAVTDDLQCFKVTNRNLKGLKGIIDVDAPEIGVAPGCKLGQSDALLRARRDDRAAGLALRRQSARQRPARRGPASSRGPTRT